MGLDRLGGTPMQWKRREEGEGSQGGRRGCLRGLFRWLLPMLMMSGLMVSIETHRGLLFRQWGTRG
jgi:hypothetical protein